MPSPSTSPSIAAGRSRYRLAGLLLALALTLPALWPLVDLPSLPATPDAPHHLFRLLDFDLALRGADWYPRWLANHGFGYGFPTLNFYAPLTYYLAEFFHLLGFGAVLSLKLVVALAFLSAAAAVYGLAEKLAGPWGGVLAAAVYSYAPYHLILAYVRGAVPEHVALALLPLPVWAIWRITQRGDRWAVAWGALGLAGLVLAHNLTALLAAPFLLVLGLALLAARPDGLLPQPKGRAALDLLTMALLSLGLSAFFWLPALAESGLIHASRVATIAEEYTRYLYRPGQLLSLSPLHGYAPDVDMPLTNPALGLLPVLLALGGLAAALAGWRGLDRGRRLLLIVLAITALAATAGLLAAWEPLWRRLPRIALVQYPARWQTVIGLCLALLSAFLLRPRRQAIPAPRRSLLPVAAAIGLSLALAAAGLSRLDIQAATVPTRPEQPLDEQAVTLENLTLHDYSIGIFLQAYGGHWFFEYLPRSVQVPREELFVAPAAAADAAPAIPVAAQIEAMGPGRLRLAVDSPQAWPLRWHQFYFPGWQVWVDGAQVATAPAGDLGLVGAEIAAGQHTVEIAFGDTTVRRLGWLISLMSLAALALLAWPSVRRSRSRLAAAGVGVLLVLAFAGLVLLARGRAPTITAPAPVQANFDGQVQLLGYDLRGEPVPGQRLEVALHWLALQPPQANLKVFVHLTDEQGRAVAQHDGEPGFFFSPTTRWQAGEVVPDIHPLALPVDLAPGRYVLRAGLYDPAAGAARLPVLNADGQSVDNQVELGVVEIR